MKAPNDVTICTTFPPKQFKNGNELKLINGGRWRTFRAVCTGRFSAGQSVSDPRSLREERRAARKPHILILTRFPQIARTSADNSLAFFRCSAAAHGRHLHADKAPNDPIPLQTHFLFFFFLPQKIVKIITSIKFNLIFSYFHYFFLNFGFFF